MTADSPLGQPASGKRPSARLLLVALPLTLALLSAGAFFAYRNYRAERARTVEQTVFIAHAAAAETDRFLDDRLALLASIAAGAAVRSADPAQMRPYFAELSAVDPTLANIAWTDNTGIVRARTAPDPPGGEPVNIADREHFQTVIQTREPFVSAGLIARNQTISGVSVVLSVPSYDSSGALRGVLGNTIPVEDLARLLDLFRLNTNGRLIVVDRHDQVIIDGSAAATISDVSRAPLVIDARARQSGVTTSGVGLRGERDQLIAFSPAPTGNWLLFVDRPAAEAFAPAQRALRTSLATLLGMLILGILGVRWAGRHLDRLAAGQARALVSAAAALSENARLFHQAEEAAARKDESLALVDTLLNSAPVGMAFFDNDLRSVRVNAALASVSGAEAADTPGLALADVMPGLDEATLRAIEGVRGTGEPLTNLELSGGEPFASGQARYWSQSYYPIRTSQGQMLGVGAVVEEITGRKQVEAERTRLLAAEQGARARAVELQQQYQLLTEAIPQIVWTARADGSMDYYNQHWFDYTGLTFEESEGMGWLCALHPEDSQATQERWLRSVQTGETFEQQFRLRRQRDGRYYWHLGRAVPLPNDQGQVLKWFGTCTDIDDEKRIADGQRFLAGVTTLLASSFETEATLSSVAEQMVPFLADWCAIYSVTPDGSLGRVALVCTNAREEAILRELLDRFPINMGGQHPIAQVLRSGKPVLDEVIDDAWLERATSDPGQRTLLLELGSTSRMTLPLIAREQRLGVLALGYAASGRRYGPSDLELAEHVARRAALSVDNARLYEQAQTAVQVRNDFLSAVSHDLKSPLTTVKGMAQVLHRRVTREPSPDGERIAEGLARIDAAAGTMTAMIDQLMDVARLQIGQPLVLELAEVDLIVMARRLLETHQSTAPQHQLLLQTTLEELRVRCDELRTERVLENLISNAVKYSPAGGSVTMVINREERAGQSWARVTVTDQGLGIPAADLPFIFERFRRASNVVGRIKGTGIGLAGARQIAEEHGGSLEIASVEGQGSTVTLLLPVSGPADL